MSAAGGPESLYPFIFVGCWNRRGAPRDAVAAAIMKTDVDKVILGGDNVYPLQSADKEKKEKKHEVSVFEEGVKLYSGKRMFAVLGNHNVKDVPVGAAQLAYKDWVLPMPYYIVRFKEAALVCLDTNSMADAEDVKPMAAWLQKTIAELKAENQPYFVIQHEPYASYKKAKPTTLTNGSTLLYEMVDYKPLAILCADTHNYQVGVLDVRGTKIVQFVVGTGGALHDPIKIDTSNDIIIAADISYKFVNHIEGFGYLLIESNKREFVKVADWSLEATAGGRRGAQRKTRRRLRGAH
jgi:hypothetical protein